jgi:hypothetical protein
VLLERAAPRRELEVEFDWPASLSGSVTVSWRATRDGCMASLGYSNDGGKTWLPVSLPSASDPIEINAAMLPGSSEGLFELIVTDGSHTSRVRSQAYSVDAKGCSGSCLRRRAP